ncbi:MAG: CehA/McbA family metallohydrolase [Clostridiales bacterium]|jgi:hypothetical protein|nr:CehA/McbA family metallohydrolase [Clostridiales bacterium]
MKFYPFELHCHTRHSDGNFTPATLVEAAKAAGLFGISLTDHNAVSGLIETAKEGEKNSLIVLLGTEWTTFYGHLTVYGAANSARDSNAEILSLSGIPSALKIDWRTVNPATIIERAKDVRAAGGCVGLAHPCRPGNPVCTGGYDEWNIKNDIDYGAFTHFEVWSGLSPQKDITNRFALEKYRRLCAAGVRLACLSGRDWHSDEKIGAYAATYLGIDGAPTALKALDSIKNRRTYISVGVRLQAELIGADGRRYFFGDVIPKGKYVFCGSLSEFDRAYTQKYGVAVEKICLRGNTAHYEIELDGGGQFRAEIDTKDEAFLQTEVIGKIEGDRTELLLATPFFTEVR